ncbi:hypothetical protein NEOLI_002552 [Neolecta irregularis DAH-3]|uniref:ELYS-like domain-containing protein n=1 Tax=Neolecta irregularis (strain DAH-3) TaxID=1198029 RepID=A0A1U7LJ76_NEOID|nr:hypothetical protein NEOLI_002552 [Neolecta irregularis DAH-3]|eukprot:OLL22678.1 hypothetical protein NEOLI_002552 [Neolecta irregularis DAH-3]
MQIDRFATTFSLNPSIFPYSKSLVATITRRREQLGQLFIDLFLTQLAQLPNAPSFYPPKSLPDLKNLYAQIDQSNLNPLQKQSYYYYLLKDWGAMAEKYANSMQIPETYRRLIDGFFSMDRFEFEDAVRHLSTPSLYPNFSDKIIETFIRFGGENGALLALTFINSAQPPLTLDNTIKLYVLAMVDMNLASAFMYYRTCPAHLRHDLFTSIIDFCLDRNSGSHMMQLLDLPMSKGEQQIFSSHLKVSAHRLAYETLLVWNIQRGNPVAALSIASSIESRSSSHEHGKTAQRRELINGLEKSLTSLQRVAQQLNV